MQTTNESLGMSSEVMLLSQPSRKRTLGACAGGLNYSPNSNALISPWLLWRTLQPFHPFSVLMNLQLVATCLAAERTAGVSVRVSASLPMISRGSLALFSSQQTAWLPDAISPRTVALLPRWVQPQVRSAGVPMLKIFARFLLTVFRMRALRTGASVLGLTPTSRTRSASSIDSIWELKRQSARKVLLRARLFPLRNQQLKELSEFRKSLKAWMFYTDSNSPTAPAMSLPYTLSILAAIMAMASSQDCSAKSTPFLKRGTLSRCLLSPSQAWRDLSESHSSLMAQWTRGLTRMMLFSLQSMATLLPMESMRSMESLVSSQQGREVQAKGPLLSAPTGQTSARLPLSSECSIFSTQVLISVALPLPEVPRSWKPPISSANLMQRVQWMHLFMWVTTSGPTFLSCTARLYSLYLPAWQPQKWELFCRSHSPP